MPKSLTDFKLTVLGAPWELEAQKNFGRGPWMGVSFFGVFLEPRPFQSSIQSLAPDCNFWFEILTQKPTYLRVASSSRLPPLKTHFLDTV